MKKYRLKKDFPGSEIGDVWVKADSGFMSPEGRETIKMHEHLFEPFNDWFEESKEDYIRVIESFINYVEEADDSFYCDESVKKFAEKLKAWKRLEENGFRFTGWDRHPDFPGDFRITASDEYTCDDKYLDLLFGGEE